MGLREGPWESPGPVRRQGHDYLLKFLLVGDSDVGKGEILSLLEGGASEERLCGLHAAVAPRETVILLEGKAVRLQVWDTSGQGRFGTIIRSYSRGAQGILLVYDITNRWSFQGIRRWIKEVEELAPGIPKVLLGNRLHLEFNRRVSRQEAEAYARKRNMEYFEVSTLAAFNIHESMTELSRLFLERNGMERLWAGSRVRSLQPVEESACRTIVRQLPTVHDVSRLPLPPAMQRQLTSFADSGQLTASKSALPRYPPSFSRLPLPPAMQRQLTSFADSGQLTASKSALPSYPPSFSRLPLPPAMQRQLTSFADSGQLTASKSALPRSLSGKPLFEDSSLSNSCRSKHRRTRSCVDGSFPPPSPLSAATPRPRLHLMRRLRSLTQSNTPPSHAPQRPPSHSSSCSIM